MNLVGDTTRPYAGFTDRGELKGMPGAYDGGVKYEGSLSPRRDSLYSRSVSVPATYKRIGGDLHGEDLRAARTHLAQQEINGAILNLLGSGKISKDVFSKN